MHPNVHCSTAYNSQDMGATYVSIDRGVDKDAMKYYSAIKKDIMSFTAPWTNLEIIIQSEGSLKTNIRCKK